MRNETILKKAIEKAVKNGMDKDGRIIYILGRIRDKSLITDENYFDIIFSHSFAKAFWNKSGWQNTQEAEEDLANLKEGKGWEFHLQQMVLDKEPLKYLEKFLVIK